MNTPMQEESNLIKIEKIRIENRHKHIQDALKEAAINAIYSNMAGHAKFYESEKYPDADNDVFMIASRLIRTIRATDIKSLE